MNLCYNNYPTLASKGCPLLKSLKENPKKYPWKSLQVKNTFVDDSCLCVKVEVELENNEKYTFVDWHLSEEEFAAYFFIQHGSFAIDVEKDPLVKRILHLNHELDYE